VLRKICGAKREQATADWRKLHNEELLVHTKYYSGYRIWRMRFMWHAWKRHAYGILVGKCEGKRLL